MSDSKRPLKVFLCHAHSDQFAVRSLYNRLAKDGIDAWLDKEKIIGGQNYEKEIRKAVHDSDVIIVCLSKEFKLAGFRQREVKWALDAAMNQPEGEIFIIPLRLEECETLESLSELHWVDLFEESGYRRLMLAFNEKSKRIEADFDLQEKHSAKPSDESFVKEIVEELKKQEEKPSFWGKIISAIRIFLQQKNIKLTPTKNTTIIVLISLIITISLNLPKIAGWFSPPPIVVVSATPTFTLITQLDTPSKTLEPIVASKTPTLTFTPTNTLTLTPKPSSIEITDNKGVSMILVPFGYFKLGYNSVNNQRPVYEVLVSSFYIDKYEVSQKEYVKCVESGNCIAPKAQNADTYITYNINNEYPIVDVSWEMASTYCKWRGARLPTEAEWEKAARGYKTYIFPWGNTFHGDVTNLCDSECLLGIANMDYNDGYSNIAPIDSLSEDVSSYGVYQMMGNVSEWVSDFYENYYDLDNQLINPKGPSGQVNDSHVVRGGNFSTDEWPIPNSIIRFEYWYSSDDIGFRCAYSDLVEQHLESQ